jgi:SNF2 family DNA or RNA helicase
VNQFVAPDRHIFLLTATPTSKPEDTYSYIKIKTPQIYRSFGHWQNLHVLDRDIFGTITAYQNLEQLADNFAINSVKRTKREVFGNVMEPIYQQMPYELDPKHYKLYVRLAEEQLLLLDNGDKIDATTAQRLRHALQQIVVNYGKFSGNPEDRSKAFDVIDQVIEEVDPMDKSKSKLVIWTYYVATSESVTAYLKQKFGDRAVVAAYGKVNSQKAIDAIMTDPEARILVAQPSSCGVGLNLQHVCSENLFIEMATVPMQIRQALGRTDRVGQKVRPTMRFAQAVKTIQVKLFNDLLKNDDLVTQVERSPASLRQEIFGGT